MENLPSNEVLIPATFTLLEIGLLEACIQNAIEDMCIGLMQFYLNSDFENYNQVSDKVRRYQALSHRVREFVTADQLDTLVKDVQKFDVI